MHLAPGCTGWYGALYGNFAQANVLIGIDTKQIKFIENI